MAGELVGGFAWNGLLHQRVERGTQADVGDKGRVIAVSLELARLDGLETGVGTVERILLDPVLAAIGPRDGELRPPGRFLGMREDSVDLRIGGEEILHDRHGRIADPLAVAGGQDLDVGIFGEDVLHALVAVDRRG